MDRPVGSKHVADYITCLYLCLFYISCWSCFGSEVLVLLVLIWIYYVLSVTVMETEAHTDSQVEKWYFAGIHEDLTKITVPIF
jgi:hypothetical protein